MLQDSKRLNIIKLKLNFIKLMPPLGRMLKMIIYEPGNEHVQRVVKQLQDREVKLFCHFVVLALKPLNIFSTAFQTHASRIDTLQADVRRLLCSFVSNFIDPEVMKSPVYCGVVILRIWWELLLSDSFLNVYAL